MSTQKSSAFNKTKQSVLTSPALSQISQDGRVPFTPAFLDAKKKKTSTPFFDKLKSIEANSQQSQDVFNEIQNIGVKRKRRLEDLFGDICDLEDVDNDDNFFKRPKTDEERDMETIDRILEARKAFISTVTTVNCNEFDRLEALHKFKKQNLSKTIPKWVVNCLNY